MLFRSEFVLYSRTLSAAEIKSHADAELFSHGEVFVLNKTQTQFNNGDSWTCEITPMDIDSEGVPKNSSSLLLSAFSYATESEAALAIRDAIQSALFSSYLNFTYQKIYSRQISNAQNYGTFDIVAKKGSKVWAFNYITNGESYVRMPNMTPVLYTSEFANLTQAQIISKVGNFINLTK